MKKLLGVILVLLLLTSCTQQKIGYVDIQEVVKEFNGAKDAEKSMQTESQNMSASLDKMAAEFQANVQDYQKNMATLSPAVKAQREQVLGEQQQQMQQMQQTAQQQIQTMGQQKMEDVFKQVDEYIKKYAQENGYSFILGTTRQTNAILYGEEKADITAKVIESLNAQYVPGSAVTEAAAETPKPATEEKK